MRKFCKLICVLAGLCLYALISEPGKAETFKQATDAREWKFPRDHGRHDGFKLEWWYFTGNMQDSEGRQFGYQLTFFRNGLSAVPTTQPSGWRMSDVYFAHAAVSDVQDKHFEFKDRLQRSRPGLAFSSDKGLDVNLLGWSAKMTDGRVELKADEKNLKIDLQLTQGKGPILEGPGGVNQKGHAVGQASYYYSMTRFKTVGTLMSGGKLFQVSGLSWMDHEFSSDAMASNQVGWDWMGLQLNDGSDLMVYRMRNTAGKSDYLSGTWISAAGEPKYLSELELKIDSAEQWTSPISGGRYPQLWTVQVKDQPPITVSSDMPGQELITTSSTKVNYFEGCATVRNEKGIAIGRGYLEMTGYSAKN